MTRPLLRHIIPAIAAVLALAMPLVAQGDRFEQKLAFEIDKSLPLNGVAGPVKVPTLKIANLGRGYSRGGISLRSVNQASELSTTLRFSFEVNNPTREEWQVEFTIELMDKSGKVIDRLTKKEDYDDEQKVLTVEHPLLEYVMPMVSDVRITLQGRKR
jgi:hypothetical protein